jgi:hypothetical protein
MRDLSALGALSRFVSYGTLLLCVIVPHVAGQSSELKKSQTQNWGTLLESASGAPFGPKAGQPASGMPTNPFFANAARLLAVPVGRIKLPEGWNFAPSRPALTMPPTSLMGKVGQTNHAPPLNLSNPFNVHDGPPEIISLSKVPQALRLESRLRPPLCSVPLLLIRPDPGVHFISIRQAPAPSLDQGMIVKPPVPSCDE